MRWAAKVKKQKAKIWALLGRRWGRQEKLVGRRKNASGLFKRVRPMGGRTFHVVR